MPGKKLEKFLSPWAPEGEEGFALGGNCADSGESLFADEKWSGEAVTWRLDREASDAEPPVACLAANQRSA